MKTEEKKTTKKEDKVIPFPKEKEKKRIKNAEVKNEKTTSSSKTL
jgi:hypothetical protein